MKDFSHKRPKLEDVARLAQVGNATVSRVLNGGKNVSKEAAARVEEAILALDYKPNRAARSLKGASSGIIGMIVPSISDMFFSRCAEAVEKVVRQNGGMLIVTASHDSPRSVLDSFRQMMLHQLDGLILVQSAVQDPGLLDYLNYAAIPVVGIDRPLPGNRFPSVLCDNYAGAYSATSHLVGHGLKAVINIQVKPRLYTMRERRRGYEAAMEQAGLPPETEAISSTESAMALIQSLRQRPVRPLGIFAANNLAARYMLEAAHTLGTKIPDELAILSFDDFDLADSLNPPMSVVQQPVDEIGSKAAAVLFRHLNEEAPTSPSKGVVTLPTRLVLRASCGCNAATQSTSNK